MFDWIASLVNRWGWVLVVAWVALAVTLQVTAPPWKDVTKDDDVRFFPADYPSVIGQGLLERGFPDDVASSQVVVIAERTKGGLTKEDFAFIDRLGNTLDRLRERDKELGIRRIYDHRTIVIGPRLVGWSKDRSAQAALTQVSLKGTYVSKQVRIAVERIEETIHSLEPPPAGLIIGMTGSAAVGRDMNNASIQSISATTWATIILVVVILLVVYRSPLLAMIPLATIALSTWVSLSGIALMTKIPGLNFQVINITNIFVIVVLFGAGTDYCLFLIARYREELGRGRTPDDALAEAISQVGGALVASAGTVIVGLGMLWFSTFAKIQYTGPAIALSLAVGLLASLTLAPVLLHWLRGAVFWPFQPPHMEKGQPVDEAQQHTPLAGFWAGVSNAVVRRPGVILALSIGSLVPFAVVGARTQPSYNQIADLNSDKPSVTGARMVQRYFAVGELGPSTVLVRNPKIDFRSDEGRAAIEVVSKQLAELPSVAEIRSISRPLGRYVPPAKTLLERLRQQGELLARPLVDARYVSTLPFSNKLDDPTAATAKQRAADRDHITRIDVVFKSDPFSGESLANLDRVRATLEADVAGTGPLAGSDPRIGFSGATALVSDLRRVTNSDEHRMYILVTIGVYVILVLLLRRPLISLYLIATVILGYLASLGVTELVFRALHNGPEPWVGLDWKVGFFLFVILVAVGEDYNIFLMARVIEEERKYGPIEGTRRAVAHTGGIISSCGVIMAGTFGSMLFGSLTALRELGFALGLGVLLDTFVVRPILVPAFVVLWHRARPLQSLDAPALAHHHATNGVVHSGGNAVPMNVPAGVIVQHAPRGQVPRPPSFKDHA
jgi:putative drug exporter of the RND superfamily